MESKKRLEGINVSNKKLLPCNFEQLNERILNLGIGIAQMGEQDTIRVHKSFLVSVLGYMEELLSIRNKIASGEYAPVVHGYWIKRDVFGEDPLECSACGNSVSVIGYKICPSCGAIMLEDEHVKK